MNSVINEIKTVFNSKLVDKINSIIEIVFNSNVFEKINSI
jgi:hypothetical protein